jgi:hypothetical protein
MFLRLCQKDACNKQGKVTDVKIWRAGFMEDREVLVGVLLLAL